jgi:acyl-CoA thioester hydrolase
MDEYSKDYEIRWSDIDANGHVNYAAYIDAAGDLRYHFFSDHGFTPARFEQLGIGPVYTALQARFLREVRMGETVTITFSLTGLSPSGVRWKVHHEVLKTNGKLAVSIDIDGAFLDLSTRRLAPPSPELLQVFQLIPHVKAVEVLSERRKY